ncbi:tyrosine-type recombinase/integrase [Rhodococcus hoagii]|nr:tyrosine-type recombinase/integrase [Prescottella equi]
MARQQLPPQIRKIELQTRKGGRPVTRYQLTVDTGVVDGKRKQLRKRFETEAEARAALAKIIDQKASGTYVSKRRDTVADCYKAWLDGRTGIKPSSLASLRDYAKPVIDGIGHIECQNLKKSHIDTLLRQLELGTLPKADGTPRRPYGNRARQKTLMGLRQMLSNEVAQGHLARNVAMLVDMPQLERKTMQTFDVSQAQKLLTATLGQREAHAWHLALIGLRRGELAGLKWSHIDMQRHTVTISDTRVNVDGRPQDSDTKTTRSLRTLPLPDPVFSALLTARAIQTCDRAEQSDYSDEGYVVADRKGRPYLPDRLTRAWGRACRSAGLPVIRLHDARHTCATLMHHQGVPIVTIAAWLGHVDAGFTMRTYAHVQPDSLALASQTYAGVVTIGDKIAV